MPTEFFVMKKVFRIITPIIVTLLVLISVALVDPRITKPERLATHTTTTTATTTDKYWDVKAKVGYLHVPNTSIDDAVVQAKDNDYFLRRDKYGEYSYDGCYFVDYECDMKNLSRTTIIYGHNLMDESRYFGQLMQYKDLDFYKKSPVITFNTNKQEHKWKVCSVFLANTSSSDGQVFVYNSPNFADDKVYGNFIKEIQHRSLINTTVDVKSTDKLLLLSTCDYSFSSEWRFVVVARMVRPNESENVDVKNAKENPNPLYPDAWYRRYGGVKPTFKDDANKNGY